MIQICNIHDNLSLNNKPEHKEKVIMHGRKLKPGKCTNSATERNQEFPQQVGLTY